MSLPSVPREFFDRLLGDENPVLAIRRLTDQINLTFETYWLDFKGEDQPKPGHVPDPKQQEKSNRKTWSEYLSAFANTGGGVVIWGIDARWKMVDGRKIDYAGDEALITDPIQLASKLHDWHGQATDPPLSGVEIKPFPAPEDPMKGFILCYVPEGPYKPYQSLQTDDKQYYHRGGTSNFVMPKSMLASLFYPKTKPVFRLLVTAKLHMSSSGQNTSTAIHVNIEIANRGTCSAKDVSAWVSAKKKGNPAGPIIRVNERWVLRDEGARWEIWSRGLPLHAGQSLLLFAAETTLTFRVGDLWKSLPSLQLGVEVFCENQERQVFALEIEGRDLEDNLPHQYQYAPEN